MRSSYNRSRGVSRVDPSENSRSNLLTKIKFLEDELTRLESERRRLLHQLDRVCEEKDTQIQELRGQLYEKGVEIDHQRDTLKDEQNRLKEQINDLKSMVAFVKASGENDIHQLTEEKCALISKLEDLKEYMEHKELTMERIKELEQNLESCKISFDSQLKSYQDQMEIERQNIRKQIAEEVTTITDNLEETCLKKISADARLALDKCNQLNEKLTDTQDKLVEEKKLTSQLTDKLQHRQLRLDVADCLLQELLRALQRKYICRKDAAVQVYLNDRQ